jgi:hypothetical protein
MFLLRDSGRDANLKYLQQDGGGQKIVFYVSEEIWCPHCQKKLAARLGNVG